MQQHIVDPNNLQRGDFWDLHEVYLPAVIEEWGHFKSYYYVIKSYFPLEIYPATVGSCRYEPELLRRIGGRQWRVREGHIFLFIKR